MSRHAKSHYPHRCSHGHLRVGMCRVPVRWISRALHCRSHQPCPNFSVPRTRPPEPTRIPSTRAEHGTFCQRVSARRPLALPYRERRYPGLRDVVFHRSRVRSHGHCLVTAAFRSRHHADPAVPHSPVHDDDPADRRGHLDRSCPAFVICVRPVPAPIPDSPLASGHDLACTPAVWLPFVRGPASGPCQRPCIGTGEGYRVTRHSPTSHVRLSHRQRSCSVHRQV